MEVLLKGLRATAEASRLRILAVCSRMELTVTDLTHILGQSQPRVSRHLKLLVDAGLLERNREGVWAYYRVANDGGWCVFTKTIVNLIPSENTVFAKDMERLEEVKRARAVWATEYFGINADHWDRIRSLHVDDVDVERALNSMLEKTAKFDLLDIGTGTGRILEVLGDRVERAVGIDLSHEMLAVARANIERAGLINCQVRHGDMYHLPLADHLFDVATIHFVLHYADDPARVITEAARILKPTGKLVVIDFKTHSQEHLRIDHGHQRLGFGNRELENWFRVAGLESQPPVQLGGKPLTVCLWSAIPQIESASVSNNHSEKS